MAAQGLSLRQGAHPQQVLHLVAAMRKAGYRELHFYDGEHSGVYGLHGRSMGDHGLPVYCYCEVIHARTALGADRFQVILNKGHLALVPSF